MSELKPIDGALSRYPGAAAELKQIVLEAAKWFKEVSSADGSGHADLGRALERMLAEVEERAALAETTETEPKPKETP